MAHEIKLPSHHDSSISLIARLDHLEFIMKYLERKQRCIVSTNVVPVTEKQQSSSDSASKEAYFKGTLLDRVASLEHRLFQLCVEMDSSGSSYPLSRASTRTSGESSSSQGSKGEISYSFPTFNNLPNNADKGIPQNHNNKTLELQGKSEDLQHQKKNPCPDPKKQVVEKNRAKKSDKKYKSAKNQIAPTSWPHLKLLGC